MFEAKDRFMAPAGWQPPQAVQRTESGEPTAFRNSFTVVRLAATENAMFSLVAVGVRLERVPPICCN
jgi:hypothetical protein